jgi:diguanylate cyclase (GGDEF)-like protein
LISKVATFLATLVLVGCCAMTHAQALTTTTAASFDGVPIVRRFGPEQHGVDANFSAGIEIQAGELLFANSDGLVRYASGRFELQEQTKGIVATSMDRCDARTVAAGAVDDFGNFILDDTGAWNWQSLRAKDDLSLGQVWSALCFQGTQYFVTSQALYLLRPGQALLRIATKARLNGGYRLNSGVIFTGKHTGIYQLDSHDQLVPAPQFTELPKNGVMTAVQRAEDVLLFFDADFGVFQQRQGQLQQRNSAELKVLSAQRPYVARMTPDGGVVVATLTSEVWWLDRDLNVRMRRTFDVGGILDLTLDGEGGVWAAAERGLFRISWPAPWTQYATEEGLKGNPNDTLRYRDALWVASSSGVYRLVAGAKAFAPVGIAEQQSFGLAATPAGLLSSYGIGVYNLQRSQFVSVFADDIVDTLYPDRNNPNWLFALRDDGLKLVNFDPTQTPSPWSVLLNLARTASVDKIIPLPAKADQHRYFIASRRPFVLTLDRSGKQQSLREISGLPETRALDFFDVSGQIFANTDSAFWRFQEQSDRFIEDALFGLPVNAQIYDAFADTAHHEWFVGRKALYSRVKGSTQTPLEIPLPRAGVRLSCVDQDQDSLLLCDTTALLRVRPQTLFSAPNAFFTRLDSLKRNGKRVALQDQIELAQNDVLNVRVSINSAVDPVHYRGRVFAVNDAKQAQAALPAWGDVTRENVWSISELQPGKYIFEAQGQGASGHWAKSKNIEITIAGRWWQSGVGRMLAVTLALLTLASIGALIAMWRHRRLASRARSLALEVEERTQSLAQQALTLERLNQRLSDLALRDGLTGVANRRRLDEELALIQRKKIPSALILLDLDHFKRYNDKNGHLAGDDLLTRSAQLLASALAELAPTALFARYGGEEFAALLPNCELAAALEIADQLRAKMAAACIDEGVTMSAGVAQLHAFDSERFIEALIAAADAALYRAKSAGRNKVLA